MIADREVQLLAALAEGLKTEYQTEEDLSWSRSPFGWIRKQSSRRKGAIGEKLVAGWCAARDINVLRSPDAEADRILEGVRTEIKFSTLWENQSYRFQQIRDQDYELLVKWRHPLQSSLEEHRCPSQAVAGPLGPPATARC